MTETEKKPKKKRTRSPSYPYVDFEDALQKTKSLYEVEKRHPIPLSSVAKHWNYGEKSSGLKLTLATLKKFGLLTESGAGYVKVSDDAFKIIVDERPESEERQTLIQQLAFMPELYKNLWNKYGADLPADSTLRHHFIVELGFNEKVVDSVIKDYKNTIAFSKLNESVISSPNKKEENVTMQEQRVFSKAGTKEIPVFLDDNKFAMVPYPLTEDDFNLLLDQLKLLKKRLVKGEKDNSEDR